MRASLYIRVFASSIFCFFIIDLSNIFFNKRFFQYATLYQKYYLFLSFFLFNFFSQR